jgi:hypothetical protein
LKDRLSSREVSPMYAPVEVVGSGLVGLPAIGGAIPLRSAGRAEAGMVLPSPTGNRFFYGTAGDDCLFVHVGGPLGRGEDLGKLYSQPRAGFVEDVSRGPTPIDRARADRAAVRTFLDVYTGVLRATNGPRAWALTNMVALVRAGHVVPNYLPYIRGAEALLSNRVTFEKYLPTFDRLVLTEWFWGNIESVPPSAGRAAGMWIGRIGEGPLRKRFTAVGGALRMVLAKVADHVADRQTKLDDRQADLLAGHVETQLAAGGTVVPYRADSLRIIREVAGQAYAVREAIRQTAALLDSAFASS